jgi:hypothetical protein
MPYTDLIDGNPFEGVLPLEIWLLIRKFKIELETADKLSKIQRLDKLIRHHLLIKRSPYTTSKQKRCSKHQYQLFWEERAELMNK